MVVVDDEDPDHGVVDGGGDHDQRGVRAVDVVDGRQDALVGHDDGVGQAVGLEHQEPLVILRLVGNPELSKVIQKESYISLIQTYQ